MNENKKKEKKKKKMDWGDWKQLIVNGGGFFLFQTVFFSAHVSLTTEEGDEIFATKRKSTKKNKRKLILEIQKQ